MKVKLRAVYVNLIGTKQPKIYVCERTSVGAWPEGRGVNR